MDDCVDVIMFNCPDVRVSGRGVYMYMYLYTKGLGLLRSAPGYAAQLLSPFYAYMYEHELKGARQYM
jgi:hypothetical protein